jgi:septum formation protein
MRLILASASPRRAELLTAAGYSFAVHAVDIDERVQDGETPREYVQRLAREKAARAWELLNPAGGSLVLGADTAVVVDDDILGKPRDASDAARMLRRLSGRPHEVMTGVSVVSAGDPLTFVETTTVWFAPLDESQVAWYVASGEGVDKAGAYAIQGRAARFIPRIDGSYSNVVGLPIAAVAGAIARLSGRSTRLAQMGNRSYSERVP